MDMQLPPLGNVPHEIISLFVHSPELSVKDIQKNLRRTCRAFKIPADQRLFRRVCLSRLRSHLYAFLNISLVPDLAVLVKELVWLEHPEFLADQVKAWLDNLVHEGKSISNDQQKALLQSFWGYDMELDICINFMEEGTTQKISSEVKDHFLTALKRMPHVSTLASQSIHNCRTTTCDSSNESIILAHAPVNPETSNEGFFKFLQPAMECRESVSNLIWEQEIDTKLAGAFNPDVFTRLTSIQISFFNLPEWRGLVDCLQAARDLRTLHLTSMGDPERHVFDQICRGSRWDHLTVVQFVNIGVLDDNLIAFVEGHGTLRHLRVNKWPVRVETQRQLSTFLRHAKLEFDTGGVVGEEGHLTSSERH